MGFRRSTVAGLALLTSITLAAAGCGVPIISGRGSDKSPTPSPTPEKPAREVLTTSTKDTTTSTYKFTMTAGEGIAEGAADPAAGNGRLDFAFVSPEDRLKITLNILSVGGEAWLKVDLGRAASLPDAPKLPKQWMRLDKSKVEDADELDFGQGDPLEVAEVFEAITEVRKAGERLYDGTLDLSRATDAFMVDEDHVKALGTKSSAIPFSATVDEKGRFASLEIKVPAARDFEAATWKAAYSDYGATINFTKPRPGEVVPATKEAYEIFNG
ncbi:MAG TPA: hypothetical protein VF462_01905 [Micromonosporaceae bacterium]